MGDDYVDLYGDLDEIHENEELEAKKEHEKALEQEKKLQEATEQIQLLTASNSEQEKLIASLLMHGQSLLDTARAEIERKTRQIQEIRKDRDDTCFRRNNKQPGNKPRTNMRDHWTQTDWQLDASASYTYQLAGGEQPPERRNDDAPPRDQPNPFKSDRSKSESGRDGRTKRTAPTADARRTATDNHIEHRDAREASRKTSDEHRDGRRHNQKHRGDRRDSPGTHDKKQHDSDRDRRHTRDRLKRRHSRSPSPRERKLHRGSSKPNDAAGKVQQERRSTRVQEPSAKAGSGLPHTVTAHTVPDLRQKINERNTIEKCGDRKEEKFAPIALLAKSTTEEYYDEIGVSQLTQMKQELYEAIADTMKEEAAANEQSEDITTEPVRTPKIESDEMAAKIEADEMAAKIEADEMAAKIEAEEMAERPKIEPVEASDANQHTSSTSPADASDIIETQVKSESDENSRAFPIRCSESAVDRSTPLPGDDIRENIPAEEIEKTQPSVVQTQSNLETLLTSDTPKATDPTVAPQANQIQAANEQATVDESTLNNTAGPDNGATIGDRQTLHESIDAENRGDTMNLSGCGNVSRTGANHADVVDQGEYKTVKNVSTSSTDYVIVEDENSDVTIFVTRKKKKKSRKSKC